MRNPQVVLMSILAALLLAVGMAAAQSNLVEQWEFAQLERKVDALEDKRGEAAGGCGLAVLFGAFCALWAQNTGRNPWLWFFLASEGPSSLLSGSVLLHSKRGMVSF